MKKRELRTAAKRRRKVIHHPSPRGLRRQRAAGLRREAIMRSPSRLKRIMRWLLGGLFVLAGVNHFHDAPFYERIMPPYLPWPTALVYVSGVFEIALGALVLVPRTAPLAAWGLIALLIAVFPANIHMAVHTELYPQIAPAYLWARLPLQGVFIAWAWWFTRHPVR